MVTVLQICKHCEGDPFTWRSQPCMLGGYPARNLYYVLGYSLLMHQLQKFYWCSAIWDCLSIQFEHSLDIKINLFSFNFHHWESNVVWAWDGRFNSMGHSAKYSVYTMFSSTNMKIVHFELLQIIMSNGYIVSNIYIYIYTYIYIHTYK